jgi:GNAT superfamily N-acetyltransferase
MGLGRRLLAQCTDFARKSGYRRMQLWTHESHTAACALYRAAGWSLVSSRPVHSFGQHLVEQSWTRSLV